MGALARQVVVTPPYPARRLLFDFAQQNPLENVLFTPPGNPVFPYDLLGIRPRPAWNSALYEIQQDYAFRIPVTATAQPAFSPELTPPIPKPKWNVSLYEVQLNYTALQGAPPLNQGIFPPSIDPAPRPIGRQGLLPVLEQDFLNTLYVGQETPFVPYDVSAPFRARSFVHDMPYVNEVLLGFVSPSPGNPYVPLSTDTPPQIERRFDYALQPSATIRMLSGQPPPPPLYQGGELPIRRTWNSALFVSYDIPAALIFTSGLPALSFVHTEVRIPLPYNVSLTQFQPIMKALLSAPLFVTNIPNASYTKNTGVQQFNISVYFLQAASYSVSPALDAGITLNTSTGIISVDTVAATSGSHGPYTITATNVNGNISSNAFTISLSSGIYHVDGPRVTGSTTALGTTYGTSGPHVTRDTPESKDLT